VPEILKAIHTGGTNRNELPGWRFKPRNIRSVQRLELGRLPEKLDEIISAVEHH